jgi:hypothetical protein
MLIPVHNVDGTPNEAGPITKIVDIILNYKGHTKCAVFTVGHSTDADVLGFPRFIT